MKNITYILLVIFLFSACSEEREIVELGDTVNPELSAQKANTQVVITEDNLESRFDTLSWSPASFGFQSANPEYTVEISVGDDGFTAPVVLAITDALGMSVTHAKINQIMLANGGIAGQVSDVYFRVSGSIHEDLVAVSNMVEVEVQPMEVVIEYPKLYVTGDHNGWAFDDASAIYSMKSNDVYEGYIYMDNGDAWNSFKMSYQPNWDDAAAIIGDPDASGTSGTLQIGDWGGNNIYATEGTGIYKIVADLNNQTISITKTEWAITGDFNSWGFAAMTLDTDTERWAITTDMTTGGFKFIANENWGMVYGDNELDGVLDPGTDGNNIQITEDGNYTITLDLSDAPYVYTVVKN